MLSTLFHQRDCPHPIHIPTRLFYISWGIVKIADGLATLLTIGQANLRLDDRWFWHWELCAHCLECIRPPTFHWTDKPVYRFRSR